MVQNTAQAPKDDLTDIPPPSGWRRALLWVIFLGSILYKALRILFEPACILLLIYSMYSLMRKLWFGDWLYGSYIDMALSCGLSIAFLKWHGGMLGRWLGKAGTERPLSLFIVCAALIAWYDYY